MTKTFATRDEAAAAIAATSCADILRIDATNDGRFCIRIELGIKADTMEQEARRERAWEDKHS